VHPRGLRIEDDFKWSTPSIPITRTPNTGSSGVYPNTRSRRNIPPSATITWPLTQ
jgi:hypothetical protein